jgi:hypothetical protein
MMAWYMVRAEANSQRSKEPRTGKVTTKDVSDAVTPETRDGVPKRPLTPEAQRALAEAEERRRLRDAEAAPQPAEKGGQAGPDPVRYGDWEKGGIISDF